MLTYVVSWLLDSADLGDGTLWWKLSTIITCGTLAGAVIPEVVKIFTSTESGHVREVVTASREGGASLNILSGLTAGNFSAYWMGMSHRRPDGHCLLRQRRRDWASDEEFLLYQPGPSLCLWLGRVWISRDGTGHDRSRFLWPGDRQRAVRLRILAD